MRKMQIKWKRKQVTRFLLKHGETKKGPKQQKDPAPETDWSARRAAQDPQIPSSVPPPQFMNPWILLPSFSQCYQQNPFKYKEPVTYFLKLNKSRRKVREVRLGGQPARRQEAPRTRTAAQGSGRTEEIQ